MKLPAREIERPAKNHRNAGDRHGGVSGTKGHVASAYGMRQADFPPRTRKDAGPGTTPVKGSAGTLTLQATDKLVLKKLPNTGYVYLHLLTPPPTSTPAVTATDSVPAVVAAEPPIAGAKKGLPITGGKTAMVAGAGVLLLLAGAFGVFAARRRTRFIA
jgi:hypothetical protein